MLISFTVIFSTIFHGWICTGAPTYLFNCTWQFVFSNEKWNPDYSNQLSSAYVNKSLEITNNLNVSLANLLTVISVTSLNSSGTGVMATVLTGTNTMVDTIAVNNSLKNLSAAIDQSSPYFKTPCGAPTSTTPPITTNSISIPSNIQNVTTMPPIISTSPSSSLNITVNTMITNLTSTTPSGLSTNSNTFYTNVNNTSIFSTTVTMLSVITGSTNISTSSPNTTETGTNTTTTPSNVTSDKVTNSTINFNMTTPASTSTSSSSIYSTNTTNMPNSTINTGNLTTSTTASVNPNNTTTVTTAPAPGNGSTSALNVSVATPAPNPIGTNSSQSSGIINTMTTSSINSSSTVKDLNGSSIATTTYGSTSNLPTNPPVPLTNYSLRFENMLWIVQYNLPDNIAYKNKVFELRTQIASALKLTISVVIIYALQPGSIVSVTSVPSNFTPDQINNGLKPLGAAILEPVVTTSSTILPVISTTTPSPTLPTYAIILISIFCTALFIALLFVITALICRHRRLKGYGRHQVQFFEMENGWKYGTRNQSYHE